MRNRVVHVTDIMRVATVAGVLIISIRTKEISKDGPEDVDELVI